MNGRYGWIQFIDNTDIYFRPYDNTVAKSFVIIPKKLQAIFSEILPDPDLSKCDYYR